MTRHNVRSVLLSVSVASYLAAVYPTEADARPQHERGQARASVNRPGPGGKSNKTVVHNNKNVNVNNNRDVDINVDGHGRRGYDDHYHPIATAAAVTATVAVTSAVVGSIVRPNQLPPTCVQVMRANAVYMQCGAAWYQPQYQGSNVTYIVVNQP